MSPAPALRASLELRRKTLTLTADVALTAPWTCLFGPSGSGKSSFLRCLIGFETPAEGRIELGPRLPFTGASPLVVFDSIRKLSVPPHRRELRLAAQQSWLFPGTVRDNLAAGLHLKDIESALDLLIDRFELSALLTAPAAALSGGERQRVSLARTVGAALFGGTGTRLLLLDEPFTGMDTRLRDRLAPMLRVWLAEHKLPVLSVTHDVAEVFQLGAEVLRLEDGQITAQGPAAEVLAAEKSRTLALLGQL